MIFDEIKTGIEQAIAYARGELNVPNVVRREGSKKRTTSFEEDLTVSDKAKAEEILCAMQQPMNRSVEASQPCSLPPDANEVWFKHSAN